MLQKLFQLSVSRQELIEIGVKVEKELDTLVESAWKQNGVIGARITGAVFGGSAIALVKNEYVNSFIEKVGREYRAVIDYAVEFTLATVGDGAKEL